MREGDAVTVSLCVNDPDNGQDTGHVCAVHVSDDGETIELAGAYLYTRDNPRWMLDSVKRRMRIGRRAFRFAGYRQWYGNWCWDAVGMERAQARRLIAYLLERGFTVEGAPVETDLLPDGV